MYTKGLTTWMKTQPTINQQFFFANTHTPLSHSTYYWIIIVLSNTNMRSIGVTLKAHLIMGNNDQQFYTNDQKKQLQTSFFSAGALWFIGQNRKNRTRTIIYNVTVTGNYDSLSKVVWQQTKKGGLYML